MATVFWDRKGVFLEEFMERGIDHHATFGFLSFRMDPCIIFCDNFVQKSNLEQTSFKPA